MTGTPTRDFVLVLTNYYPFDKGEEYLESELPVLAETFKTVVVAPLMTTSSSVQTRELPSGVTLVHPVAGRSTSQRIMDMAQQSFTPDRGPWPPLKAMFRRHPVHSAFDAYLESRALAAYSGLLKHEDEFLPSAGSDVCIYSYWFYLTARVGALVKDRWSPNYNVRLVSRGHGYDVNVQASRVKYLPLREELLASVDSLYPVSDDTTNYMKSTYPRFAHKVETRRLGSPGHEFVNQAEQVPLHLVTVSTIRPLKRLELVGEAVSLLCKHFGDVRWSHLGSGSSAYASEFIQQWSAALGPKHVKFVGQLANSDVHQWFRENSATVLINASSSEGVPVSIMEAMSYGLPIIATDVGGTRELFEEDMFDGLLPADITSQNLADTILRLATCEETKYREQAQASRRAWENSWHSEKNYKDFIHDLEVPRPFTATP